MNDHEEELILIPTITSKYSENLIHLSKDRVIFLTEDFTKEVSSAMSALLLHYDNENSTKEITIYIHSNGGDAAALTCIYDIIQMIHAPVKTVCLGKCYSAGAVLLAAGTKGKRYILPHAEIMIHRIQCGFPMINNTQIDHESYLSFLDNINNNIMKMLAKHTNQSLAKIKADFNSTRHIFLDAKQSIKYGLADFIL